MLNNKHDDVVQLIDDVLQLAVEKRASDIHIEPTTSGCRTRFRVDGLLECTNNIPNGFKDRLITRLKILSNLNIAETRLPQDGHLHFTHEKRSINCRISTCPTIHGEKIVLRILYDKPTQINIENLGLLDSQLSIVKKNLSKPQGLILVTGPTGSGKTISLYSFLKHINTNTKNIVTIEDPVEIIINNINQLGINLKAGLTFAKALRAFLRQDPDIIMLGEIRDSETAQIAIRAALTGHLVLSTLHANHAIDAITRLTSLGISPINVSSSLQLVIAQRLIRKIHKKTFQGRTGIFECLHINEKSRFQITNSETISNNNLTTLRQAAKVKIGQGITTQEETERVLNYDNE